MFTQLAALAPPLHGALTPVVATNRAAWARIAMSGSGPS